MLNLILLVTNNSCFTYIPILPNTNPFFAIYNPVGKI